MPIAVSWVQLPSSSPFLPVPKSDMPFLDFGIVAPNTYSVPQVLALKFQGCGVTNIKIWQDGTNCDIYSKGSDEPQLRVSAPQAKALLLNTNPNIIAYQNAVQNHDPSAFPALPTSLASALAIGDAPLGQNLQSLSAPFAVAIQAPATDHVDVRNFRLMATFETTDMPHQ